MRTAGKTTFVLIAVAALCLGAFSAAAVAGKKKDTVVVFFTGSPKFNKAGEAKAKGTLQTVTACKSQRVVKLQVLDANGAVIAAIDEDVTENTSGNWRLSGKLPTNLPAGTNSVRVKAKKRTAGKFVCKAGFSISVPIAAPTPVPTPQ
jgi:flagellar hook assembly protein FlgD